MKIGKNYPKRKSMRKIHPISNEGHEIGILVRFGNNERIVLKSTGFSDQYNIKWNIFVLTSPIRGRFFVDPIQYPPQYILPHLRDFRYPDKTHEPSVDIIIFETHADFHLSVDIICLKILSPRHSRMDIIPLQHNVHGIYNDHFPDRGHYVSIPHG